MAKSWHQFVPSEFPARLPCRLAFVGEAPADEEMIEGRPLVGPSGKVFEQILRTANIERREYYVGNVVNVQAPDNEFENLCASATEAKTWEGYNLPPLGRKYLRPEYIPHLDRLRDDLLRAQPTVIVPLGAAAVWALTGNFNIAAQRGSVMLASRLVPGVKIVPTYHPAHVIHDWVLFHVVAEDFRRAMRESEFPEIRQPKRELWIAPTLADIRHFRRQWLAGADLLSVDIETSQTLRQITCIGFAPDASRALVVPFWDLRKPSRSYWPTPADELAVWEEVRAVLEGPTPKLFQNGPFDIYYLWDRYGIRVRNYHHDTRLVHHALWPELPKSLLFMGASYANAGPWKMLNARHSGKRDE